MFDGNSVSHMFRRKQVVLELFEHLRQPLVECEAASQAAKFSRGWPIHFEGVEQHLHVGQLVVVSCVFHQFGASPPKLLRVDTEDGENRLFLHVGRRKRYGS